jgi:hypothetical protein
MIPGEIIQTKESANPEQVRQAQERTYETNKEAVDQTDAEKRADLFRVHLLRRRGLMTQIAPKRTLRPAPELQRVQLDGAF